MFVRLYFWEAENLLQVIFFISCLTEWEMKDFTLHVYVKTKDNL